MAKDVFKGGDDWIWNQMQGIISPQKPAYSEKDQRCQPGWESDNDSVILTKEEDWWSEWKSEFAYNTWDILNDFVVLLTLLFRKPDYNSPRMSIWVIPKDSSWKWVKKYAILEF